MLEQNKQLIIYAILAVFVTVLVTFTLAPSAEKLLYVAWVSSVVVGSLAVIVLLIYTTTLKRPVQFSNLPVYQFFALTVLIISMIVAVSLLPTDTFDNVPISKIRIDTGDITTWYLAIGERNIIDSGCIEKTNHCQEDSKTNLLDTYSANTTTAETVPAKTSTTEANNSQFLFQIPYYIIIPGLLGAFIRYLYKDVREFKEDLKNDLTSLKQIFLDHKNKGYEILLAMDASLDEVLKCAKKTSRKEKEDPYVTAKDLLDICNHNNDFVYSLPPEAVTPFSKYLKTKFSELSLIETSFEKQRFQIGDKTNNKTLTVIGAFFLAPLLAVVAWLIAGLAAEQIHKEIFIVIAFGAGLSADAIVKKMWEFTGEKLNITPDVETASVKIKKLESKPASGKTPLRVEFILEVEGKPKQIEWDYGDSVIDTGGKSKSHTYTKEGKYSGKVKVTDENNNVEEKGFEIDVKKSDQT